MKAAILATAVLLSAIACGTRASGVVVAREYDPPKIGTVKSCKTTGTGSSKRTTCTTKPKTKGAEWELTIRTPDGDTDIEVSEAEFEACAQGETYPACGGDN